MPAFLMAWPLSFLKPCIQFTGYDQMPIEIPPFKPFSTIKDRYILFALYYITVTECE